jgi:CRP-like cAMP-binding protein
MSTKLLKDNIGVFNNFESNELEEAIDYFNLVSLAPGEELWANGDSRRFAGFILNGKIVVKKLLNDSKQHIILGVYGAGSIVGELTLLNDMPTSLSAKALEATNLIVIEKHKFMELLEQKPNLGLSLLKQLYVCTARRLDKSYERISSIF